MVDDDRTYLEMVTLKLELEGHTVVFATDGAAALEIARQRQPDIIFLDVVLPEVDGLEVLARLKGGSDDARHPRRRCQRAVRAPLDR
jgi:CheY-like chemotaxis protein